jgi:endonuclease YncB( thermonuclease family)
MTFEYNIKSVEKVIDGDTFILTIDLGFNIKYTVDVRLEGLDTPEKNTPEGKLVKEKVSLWLTDNKKLILCSHEWDKYGRVLGDVKTQDNQSLVGWLLSKQYARPYKGEKKIEWTAAQIKVILESK